MQTTSNQREVPQIRQNVLPIYGLFLIAASVLLVFSFGAAMLRHRPGNLDYASLFAILGLLANRSLRRTQLGIKPFTRLRRLFELGGLAALVLIPFLVFRWHNDFVSPYHNPITFILIPTVLLGLYIFGITKQSIPT